jgi:NAD(P)-dependent dehydrogenase (short-subunit alcohol dehydrogenase family)
MKRVAWIIGGTSGIGLETANRLKSYVDEVVALGRSTDHIASARRRLGDAVTIGRSFYDWRQVSLCTKPEELPIESSSSMRLARSC